MPLRPDDREDGDDALRREAERRLTDGRDPASASVAQDVILHELHVHQIELEMHNEELRQSRNRLEVSERRWQAIFEHAPTPYFVVGTDGLIQSVNAAAVQLLGWKQPRTGQLFSRLARSADQIYVHRTLARARYASTSQQAEIWLRREGGTEVPVDLLASAFEGGDGVRLLVVVRDLTEVRSAEEERRRLSAQIALASRLAAMGTLVTGVAHEINNPLAAELANQGVALEVAEEVLARLVGDAPMDRAIEGKSLEGIIEALKDAQESGKRIQRIVRDLSTFGRPDAPRIRVTAREIVDGALRWIPEPLSREATIQVQDGGAPDVSVAPGQIEQVLLNLITNAVRSSALGRRNEMVVRIGPGAPGSVRLEVIDRGSGISPEIRDRIFEPFFTTRPSGEGRGTGLGLAICHAIVTAHGGSITVESEVGRGSTFRVELPAVPVES